MENKNILLVGAHLDDIEIGMGAKVFDLLDPAKNNTVKYLICSTGLRGHRINSVDKFKARLDAHSSKFRGIEGLVYQNSIDTNFEEHRFDLNRFIETSSKLLFLENNIDIIFGPESDLHNDHRIVKELVDIIARPDSGVEQYLMYCIPGSSGFSHLYGNPSKAGTLLYAFDSFKEKKKVLQRYQDCGIIPAVDGIRGIKGIKTTNKYWGSLINSKFAEQFKIGYIKC